MITLGPRILHYTDRKGREGDIHIRIVQCSPTPVFLADDPDPLMQPTFRVDVECDWFRWSKPFPASDDLQSIFWAMWMSDIYVQKICADNGFEVFSLVAGDIKGDLDAFRK